MTIKVVHSVVKDVSPSTSATNPGVVGRSAAHATEFARGAAQGEAVVTALRTRQGQEAGRIREHKEAKSVARDVADRVKYEGEGADPHARLPYIEAPESFSD